MKRNLIIAIALGVMIFGGGMANADDEQSNWTGMYAGFHMGHGWGDTDDSLECSNTRESPVGSLSFNSFFGSVQDFCGDGNFSDPVLISALADLDSPHWENLDDMDEVDGWQGGVQLGILYQLGMVVVGGEFSASVTNMSDTRLAEIEILPINTDGIFEFKTDINFLATAVGRIGVSLMDDKLLFSFKGGLAFAQIDFESSSEWKDDNTVEGWTVGGQVDVKLTPKISAFIAYDYMEFNDIKFRGQSTFLVLHFTNYHEYDYDIDVLKFGLNYHFN